jgi:cytochrome c biogenesis protein CcmG, thiol:disulfide interchange protein DsbE
MSSQALNDGQRQRRRLGAALLPVALFAGLATLFYVMLSGDRDPSQVPSVLINKPAPDFDLPPLEALTRQGRPVPGLKTADLAEGEVTLVNVWGSWCPPCREEHPQLMTLEAMGGIPIFGINYKDDPENARRFLGALGNPYSAVGVDSSGRTFVDWGGYGVPETFILDGKGIIRYKYIGPISPESLEKTVLPMIRELQAEAK